MYQMVQEGRWAMAQLHVEAEATAKASPGTVWALVSDATKYPSWGPWIDGHYEKAGEKDAPGVGAVQVLRSAQRYMGRHITSVEKILEVDEDRHLAYTVIRGMPVRNYRGEVTLTPSEDGTHIRWTADWENTMPGRMAWRGLRTFFPEMMTGLVAAAERDSAQSQ
ncbi:MAG TPA: SRPBCC family protein [Streptosporangiaceae bacterium]|nr:SRPBCC family protein [Streptosporangiaceae bacterium]